MKKQLLAFVLCCTLALGTMATTACDSSKFVSEFTQYSSQIVPAVNSILAILQLFGVVGQAALPARISTDVAEAQQLVADFAKPGADPSLRAQITAKEAALNADLKLILDIAQVKDPAVQAKITALTTLIEAAVAEGFALVPQSNSGTSVAIASARSAKFQRKDFVGSFNQSLTAKTGNHDVDTLTPKLKLHARKSVVSHLKFW